MNKKKIPELMINNVFVKRSKEMVKGYWQLVQREEEVIVKL